MIMNRLSAILRRLVSEEQGAFLPSRSIFENISLTQELVQDINKPIRGGNIMMKIDMAKAYDTVDWEFLLKVLNAFGFSLGFCKLISNCVSSSWFSVVMNGTSKADDMVIFWTGRKKDVRSILEVLDIYAQWSGQVVNASKSSIFFSNRIPDSSFSMGNFPMRYLGVPIFSGRVKSWYFDGLLVKISKKIEGWKMRYLSAGARLLL
ncbi:uncharacterized protein LOC133873282 [Alnus glutinosa]|uniref:uncharacterized protein LOC133873282 n=1 Tax=Alnus glutinosa TaxID=3517 RepID=UPI002D77362D|nr:uncharacterized protein LOC133873282 [Alnus glutinosa]